MSEAPGPFQQWVDKARPREQLWRTAVGIVIIAIAWFVWTFGLLLVATAAGLVSQDAFMALFGAAQRPAGYTETVIVLLVALATIWGFAFGVWVVLKLLNKRPLGTLIAWNKQFSLAQLCVGAAIAAGYLAISLGISVALGNAPRRSGLEIGTWLASLAPLALVIFTQAASEELVFRGYLPQQLAARFANPLVWGLAPSVAFGLMHAANAPGSPTYAAYYVAIATIMGLVMMAMVWRTGSLAAAMGFHWVNNLGALTFAGSDAGSSSLSLFVWSPDELMRGASGELLLIGLLLAFVLSPWAPLPKGQRLARRNETRAAP
ncbi:MAG: CPBP family intramembrane metalloprotease [Hyphomonadaceae bacterium]